MKRSHMRASIRALLASNRMARQIPVAEIVKELLPKSSFRMRLTPGRRKDLLLALLSLTLEQRRIAVEKGWDRGLLGV